MRSRHFSDRKIRKLEINEIPRRDVDVLNLGANEAESPDGETWIQHVPLMLEYNDAEDWYWLYAEKRLYEQFCPRKDDDASTELSWLTLHRFITNYAWLEDSWRFIMSKPCWPLHSDVVDRMVMLYLGRKHYEENRSTAPPREHVEFLDMCKRLAEEVQPKLSHCELKKGHDVVGTYTYISHSCDESVRSWVPNLLHRVLEIDEIKLADSPVMDAARNAEFFAKLMNSGPVNKSNLDHTE